MVWRYQGVCGRPAGLRRASSAARSAWLRAAGRGVGGLGGADCGAGGGEALGGSEGGGEVEVELLFGGAFLGGFEVADDLFAIELVVVGEDFGVGHVEDFEAEDAGLLLLVDEGGVGEFGEPGVVVEGGVVDAVGAVGADVGGGNAEVLDEGGVVGAGAEGADPDFCVGRLRGVGDGGRLRWRLVRPSIGRRRCRLWGWGLLG